MDDIYAQELIDQEHSRRYIHVTVKDVVGILNRIASLMRRKRYNMDEVSVSFDNKGLAYILIAVNGQLLDVQQVINQIHKLHDVVDVYDCTHKIDALYNAIYVTAETEEELCQFVFQPVFTVKDNGVYKGIFSISLKKTPEFLKDVIKKKYKYVKRIVSLID